MSTQELYSKGARVWIPDPVTVWQGAEVVEDFKGKKLIVEFEDGKKQTLDIPTLEKLPPLRNPEILIGENDLTSLSYLHEPAVLYNLQVRFCNQNAIYTYCGIVLVAINPYEELPIYGNETIMAYRGQAMGDLDPHIFAVAEEAYTKMERENRDQSIIVSGESGAGKTVSAKYAMRYFATVGGSANETQVEKKVLASNPIMEAVGNAKTTRNDNSSRFGKYIEIDFNSKYNIIGANMRTYLLEKSRVVFQASEERNYHIFYQLCASCGLEEFKDFHLAHQNKFVYTNRGDAATIPGVDDAKTLDETRHAFTLLGFSQGQQLTIFKIISAILHLGNVKICRGDSEECCYVPKGDTHLGIMSDLLHIDQDQMGTWLCNRRIQSIKEIITTPMNMKQASFSRDALAKHIYAKIFDWIVAQINKSLEFSDKVNHFIGVLDIYGFETFEINSFEQFCINYANEKLQQQFNLHVFKLEQEEYVREQIEWKFIDFYDNQPCIDLIETKLGILDLLDEECRMPKGSDETWCNKLYDKCQKWKHFEKPRLSNKAFLIHHFADRVQYESFGFLEKNRDTVMEEQMEILRASQDPLVAKLFKEQSDGNKLKPVAQIRSSAPSVRSQTQHKKTVGSQFRDSLGLLMNTLNATTPHYVRCIKPNDEKGSFTFEPKRAVQQLRACGVLETIRISAAGFPSRWSYQDFLNRYRVLTKSKDIKRGDLKASCQKILENIIKEEDKFQFGKTKIFFRAGQVAYLEKLRADRLRACAIMIQKNVKGWLYRYHFIKLRKAVMGIQCFGRGLLARRLADFLRRTKAATIIQKNIRSFVVRRKYQRSRRIITLIQAYARGKWARDKYVNMKRHAAAVVIQKTVRMWLCHLKYQRTRRDIIIAQATVRRHFARKLYKKLKIEARSVEHMKKLNVGLENKIIALQQKIQDMQKDRKALQLKEKESKELSAQIEQNKSMEVSLKNANNFVSELEGKIIDLVREVEKLRGEKQDLISEKEILKNENMEIINILNEDNMHMKVELNKKEVQIEQLEKGTEEIIKARVENAKKLLMGEFDSERSAYQRLVQEHARLEQSHDQLRNKIDLDKESGHYRTPSDVSLLSVKSDTTEVVRDDVSEEDLKTKGETPEEKPTGPDGEPDGNSDVPLVLKLQLRLNDVEKEKGRLQRRLESLEGYDDDDDDSPVEEKSAKQIMRLHELEMENAKLQEDLNRMRKSAASEDPTAQTQEVMDQFEALQDELERRREECLQLRAIIANQTQDIITIAKDPYSGKSDLINEDGELLIAFETQKKLTRQLEAELQAEKVNKSTLEQELKQEIKRLQDDNERQQKLLSQNLRKTPQAQTEAVLQHEINRLTSENVDLREKIDQLTEQIKKLKKQLKIYAKKLKDIGCDNPLDGAEMKDHHNDSMPLIKHKDAEYLGMFEYKKEDEPQIIRNLIIELKPKMASQLLPGLPSYILFMCIRHTDYINDDAKVRSLLNNTIYGIKRIIKKRHEDLEYTVLWLACTCRLLHNLKQYSGDKAFQAENTPKQNEQCLRNFDLSEYRQVLSDVAVWIYQAVIKIMEEKVQPLIVPAVLEHEAIPGISGNRPTGMRGRTSSLARESTDDPIDPRRALDTLLKDLDMFFNVMNIHGVDPELITQVFKQLFYFVCAGATNNLLLRKDMCHWSKGMQIRYNLSHLEQWCRDQKMQHVDVTETLKPIIQASQLLQARKTDDDVGGICDMCANLSSAQIIKILNLYTPADDFEERVPISFIRKMQALLKQREELATDKQKLMVQTASGHSTLLMDTKYTYPIRFPFNPSKIRLEDVEVPDCLPLVFLKKV